MLSSVKLSVGVRPMKIVLVLMVALVGCAGQVESTAPAPVVCDTGSLRCVMPDDVFCCGSAAEQCDLKAVGKPTLDIVYCELVK